MEYFLPSVFVLLLAAAVIFVILPRFGPSVLAAVSLVLLGLGVYQHFQQFSTDYRLSTWQLGAVAYAPYLLVGGLITVILVYLLYLLPANASSNTTAPAIIMPTINNMPSANTATNPITAGINRALNSVNVAAKNNRGFGFSQV